MTPFPDYGPLCPWESPDDAGRYASVDNSLPAFEDFKRAVQGWGPLTRKGHLVLVSGGSGCGKTSLMHRCAHWLAEQQPPAQHSVHVVNLTEDQMRGADSERRVRGVYERLIDELRFEAAFTDDELEFLKEKLDSPDHAYPALSRLLCRRKRIVAALLPPSTVADEVIRYAGLRRKNTLFFAETAFDNVADTCRRKFGPDSTAPIIQLHVGALGVDDGWSYVRHFLPTDAGVRPTISEDTIRSVVETRINGSGRMTVTELQRLLRGTYERAVADGRIALVYDDFRNYALETARLI